jgi:hypothetical protein
MRQIFVTAMLRRQIITNSIGRENSGIGKSGAWRVRVPPLHAAPESSSTLRHNRVNVHVPSALLCMQLGVDCSPWVTRGGVQDISFGGKRVVASIYNIIIALGHMLIRHFKMNACGRHVTRECGRYDANATQGGGIDGGDGGVT